MTDNLNAAITLLEAAATEISLFKGGLDATHIAALRDRNPLADLAFSIDTRIVPALCEALRSLVPVEVIQPVATIPLPPGFDGTAEPFLPGLEPG